MSFPKYEAYKDSGVEWLGEVPEHWDVSSLKWLSPVLRGASPRPIEDPKYFEDEGEYGWVRIADVSASNGYLFETTQLLSPLGSSLSVKLEPESLFLSIAGSVGKPCITKIKACIHDGFVYFPQLSIDQRLLYRVFENGLCFGGLGKMGTQLNLNTETVGGIRIALPPSDELDKILDFLDHETARIDALIAEQQRLIELLKEKRQAVISHAVTKGLDPTAPMKDSGVEWLDQVPEHWDVGSLGYYSKIDAGATPDRSKPEYWNGDVPWIKTGEVKYKTIFQAEEYISIEGVNNSAARIAPKGTLLMAMYGQGVTRGRVAILGIDAAYNQACAGISVEPQLKVRFLRDYLMAAYPYIRDDGNETSQMNLSSGYIAKIKVTVPPIQEQVAISNFIERETDKFDSLISEANSVAELLQERRSALISASVTGKIDVRGWQAPASTSPAPTLEVAYG